VQVKIQGSIKVSNDAGLSRVLNRLGIDFDALLGQGGESRVFALDNKRIARVNRTGTSQAQVAGRNALLSELGRSAGSVPFAIPVILDTEVIEEHIVTIEHRLPGRPLNQVLAELEGEARASLVRAYLEAAAQIGDLVVNRPWYGDLLGNEAIRTHSFRAYLKKRASRSLAAAGRDFEAVKPAQLAAALPEPHEAAFVHLDAFPGNMLADGETVTAVIDFGASTIMGDRRLDPLTAAIYLTPPITPTATDRDRSVAREWLVAHELAALYGAAQDWIAAYWSFAHDDPDVYQWCRAILVDRNHRRESTA
jgi:hypothetical protein